jgi:hypothetical protein
LKSCDPELSVKKASEQDSSGLLLKDKKSLSDFTKTYIELEPRDYVESVESNMMKDRSDEE